MAQRRSQGVDQIVPILLAACAGALVLLWCGAAVAMAGRGIDLTDESFYLLSYRWWDSTPRAFSGAQYLYGPVFEYFGHDIAALRLFRLATVLVAHSWFAIAFLRWIDGFRPGVVVGAWRWAAGLAIVASGGATYGWLPLSPGYNDVASLGSLVLLGCLLATAATVRRTGVLPVWPVLVAGPVAIALVLAKWVSAGVILVFLVGVGIAVLRSFGARGLLRYLAAGTAAITVTLLGVGVLIGGYGEVLPQMLEVNRAVARDTNSPLSLVRMYLTSGAGLLLRSVLIVGIAALPLGLALVCRRVGLHTCAAVLYVLAPPAALFVIDPAHAGLPGGGVERIPTYTACLVAMALLVGGASLLAREPTAPSTDTRGAVCSARTADRAVVGALLGLPAVQALGTGNSLYYLAVNQYSCWTALLVLGVVVAAPRARAFVISAAACAVVVAATTGFSGLVINPYRTTGFAESDARIGGIGPMAEIQVSAAQGRELQAVRRVIDRVSDGNGPGRSVLAFDELAGVVLLVDGRSVGEAWYSATDPARSAAGIEDACSQGVPWGDRLPVLVFNRRVLGADRRALASCGLDVDTDFTRIPVNGVDPTLWVFLPEGELRDE